MKGSARYQEAWVNPTQRNPSKDEGISDQGTDPITIAIWGDPVVAQALTLLLQSSGYATRILSESSLDNPKVVKGVKLLLLTPRRSADRKGFLASLSDVREITKIPVLELVAFPGETREEETRDELWYRLPWPCRTEKLEQWIEATLAPLPRT